MLELVIPEGGVPESRGTVPVCAAAAATAINIHPSPANTLLLIIPIPSISDVR